MKTLSLDDIGILGDGKTDVTESLQNAVKEHGPALFQFNPSLTYVLDGLVEANNVIFDAGRRSGAGMGEGAKLIVRNQKLLIPFVGENIGVYGFYMKFEPLGQVG